LVRFYQGLAHVLLESGLSGARLNEILSHCLRAECVQCHINVSAEELELLALSDAPAEPLHPKLQRLRLGYCARQGCESYFYEVHLENHAEVDWEVIVRKAATLLAVSKQAAGQECKPRKPRRLGMLLGIGLLILTVFAFLMHGHLPFAAKPHKYEIDPASAASTARH
jgi:hypothetical protein